MFFQETREVFKKSSWENNPIFTVKNNWMNDPNGLVFYKGKDCNKGFIGTTCYCFVILAECEKMTIFTFSKISSFIIVH